jgi:hypothetical protein
MYSTIFLYIGQRDNLQDCINAKYTVHSACAKEASKIIRFILCDDI